MPNDAREKQIDLASKLQTLLLEDFDKLLRAGDMSPPDRATLARLLMQNGWSLDPAKLPQGLRDKLTAHFDPSELDGDVDGIQ